MTVLGIPWPVVLCILLALVLWAAVLLHRRRNTYAKHLIPALRAKGLEFVSSTARPVFDTGPFARVEFEIGRPQFHVLGIRGQYVQYRVVEFRDPGGSKHKAWAKLEFEMFRLRRIEWHPPLEDLPAGTPSGDGS